MQFSVMGWTLATLSLLVASQAPAEPVASGPLPAAETAAIDSIAKNTLDLVKAGKSAAALDVFFAKSPLITAKASELKLMASQIDGQLEVYGPISNCQLADEVLNGSIVSNRLYLCQHANYVTRWKLLIIKQTGGWAGANISYDDKIQLGVRD